MTPRIQPVRHSTDGKSCTSPHPRVCRGPAPVHFGPGPAADSELPTPRSKRVAQQRMNEHTRSESRHTTRACMRRPLADTRCPQPGTGGGPSGAVRGPKWGRESGTRRIAVAKRSGLFPGAVLPYAPGSGHGRWGADGEGRAACSEPAVRVGGRLPQQRWSRRCIDAQSRAGVDRPART